MTQEVNFDGIVGPTAQLRRPLPRQSRHPKTHQPTLPPAPSRPQEPRQNENPGRHGHPPSRSPASRAPGYERPSQGGIYRLRRPSPPESRKRKTPSPRRLLQLVRHVDRQRRHSLTQRRHRRRPRPYHPRQSVHIVSMTPSKPTRPTNVLKAIFADQQAFVVHPPLASTEPITPTKAPPTTCA